MTLNILRRAVRVLLGLTLVGPALVLGSEASWTTEPVRLILPLPAGGAADAFARAVAAELAREIAVPVIVDNRPGGNATIAASAAAKSRPDGSTILITSSGVVQNAALRKSIANLLPELRPVTSLVSIPMGFAVSGTLKSPAGKAPSLKDFAAAAKANPGKLTYASHGIGSVSHIYGETFARAAGLKMVHVPYRGEVQSIPDAIEGRLTALFGAAGSFKQHETTGALKLVAVTGEQRSKTVPDVPTFEELGYKNLTLNGWLGAFVPAATPDEVVGRINAALRRTMDNPEVRQKAIQIGFEPATNSSTEFAAQIQKELKEWPALTKDLNIQFE